MDIQYVFQLKSTADQNTVLFKKLEECAHIQNSNKTITKENGYFLKQSAQVHSPGGECVDH